MRNGVVVFVATLFFPVSVLMAQTPSSPSLTLTSPAFRAGEKIPPRYTCDGPNVSPPLNWSHAPAATRSLALIVDDPDAPKKTWVHWVIFNLAPGQTRLEEGIPKKDRLPNGAVQGRNDFGDSGYGGPCPPSGRHRYFFRLYALDRQLNLDSSATKENVMNAMKGHVLAQGELMGIYERSRGD